MAAVEEVSEDQLAGGSCGVEESPRVRMLSGRAGRGSVGPQPGLIATLQGLSIRLNV
jgi:hypothetical protein